MAVELATAYISLVADTKDLKKSIDSGVGGLSSQMEKKGSSLGSGLMKGIGGGLAVGAGVAAATGVAALGVALTKGFARLNAIDQASAKLRGLGNDAAAVEQIMANATASVRGTAFGLGDAAGVAAQMVAAGIKPGEQLEGVLKSVANSAAAAGTGLGDMGSIFAKVASIGKAQNDVLSQVAERGIPIYQALADQLGVSTDEVFALASAGEIGFAEFEAAVKKASGTVASEMGNTLKGSMDNLGASFGRIGAGLLGGVFAHLPGAIQGVTAALGPAEAKAKTFGDSLGEIISVVEVGFTGNLMEEDSFLPYSVVTRAMEFGEALRVGMENAREFRDAAGEFSAIVAATFSGNLMEEDSFLPYGVVQNAQLLGEAFRAVWDVLGSFDFSPFLELWGYLSPVSLIFKALKPMLPQLLDSFVEIGSTLGGAFSGALETILPVMGSLVEMLSGSLAEILPVLLPILGNVALVFSQMLAAVMPLVGQLLTGLMPVLGTLLTALVPIITPLLGIVAPLLDLVTAVLPPLVDLLGIVAAVALPLVQVAAEALTPILSGIGTAIATYVTPVIETLQGTLGGLVTFLTGVFTLDWETAWQGITDTFSTIFGGIGDIVKGVINAVIDVINGIIGGINSVATAVKDGTGGMIDFVIPTIPRLAEGATIQPRRGGTLAVLAEAGKPESVVDTGLMNRALAEGLAGNGGGSGGPRVQVDVHPSAQMDESVLGRVAALEMAKELRGL